MANSGIPHLIYNYGASKVWLLRELCPSKLYIWFFPSLSYLIPACKQLQILGRPTELIWSIKTRTSSSPYVTHHTKIDLLFQKHWLNKMHKTPLGKRDLRTAVWPKSQREWILLGRLLMVSITNPEPDQCFITGLKEISALSGWYTERCMQPAWGGLPSLFNRSCSCVWVIICIRLQTRMFVV